MRAPPDASPVNTTPAAICHVRIPVPRMHCHFCFSGNTGPSRENWRAIWPRDKFDRPARCANDTVHGPPKPYQFKPREKSDGKKGHLPLRGNKRASTFVPARQHEWCSEASNEKEEYTKKAISGQCQSRHALPHGAGRHHRN